MASILPYLVQALGGALAGNILGVLTRGGGGLVGRTIIGALGGAGAGYAAEAVPAIAGMTASWSHLIEGEGGQRLGDLLIGGCGGGVLGLISGLLIRER